jgi:serine/threonine-protein kinase
LAIVVRALAQARGTTFEDAFALLEGPLGAQGVDLLLELTRAKNATLRQRALQSLAKQEVRDHASPPAAVLLDMREASTCEAKRDLLERVAQDGDVRILSSLRALKARRGCGFLNTEDCWSCLRKSRALDDAIAAVAERGG